MFMINAFLDTHELSVASRFQKARYIVRENSESQHVPCMYVVTFFIKVL